MSTQDPTLQENGCLTIYNAALNAATRPRIKSTEAVAAIQAAMAAHPEQPILTEWGAKALTSIAKA